MIDNFMAKLLLKCQTTLAECIISCSRVPLYLKGKAVFRTKLGPYAVSTTSTLAY